MTDLDRLRELEPFADDAAFREQFREVKRRNKASLARTLVARNGIEMPTTGIVDVMVKRLHEYKRQTLKVLHIVSLYEQVLSGAISVDDVTPRVFAFGAKAAPGYAMAKQIIGSSTPSAPRSTPTRGSRAGSPSSSRRTTTSPSPRSSSRPPTCPSRSRSPARRPRARAT